MLKHLNLDESHCAGDEIGRLILVASIQSCRLSARALGDNSPTTPDGPMPTWAARLPAPSRSH